MSRRYVMTLEPLPGRGDSGEVAKAMKSLLRSFGLRVVAVRLEALHPRYHPPAEAGAHSPRASTTVALKSSGASPGVQLISKPSLDSGSIEVATR